MSTLAEVRIWGRLAGAAHLPEGESATVFEYDPGFAASGLELSPLRMPARAGVHYRFAELARTSFAGLPGLLADSLPDRYGNALIDAWLATQGRPAGSLSPIERLCYVGRRGMGALEFRPAMGPDPAASEPIDVAALVELASAVLAERGRLAVRLSSPAQKRALEEILQVGSSAGGARAKALIAFDRSSGEVRSGQLEAPAGFEHWILKFDGVGDASREIGAPAGYGAVELAYSMLAREAGIEMEECRLLEEGERRHFMTRRFDRGPGGERIHMQSLGALAHLDYELATAHSYEQAFAVARELRLPMRDTEQLFRRVAFNVVGRNQDDHVKNVAFLMAGDGGWRLAPAFDLTFAYNPAGSWTAQHQMSINGKRDGFEAADFRALAATAGLKRGRDREILEQVTEAVSAWPAVAAEVGVAAEQAEAIGAAQRLGLSG